MGLWAWLAVLGGAVVVVVGVIVGIMVAASQFRGGAAGGTQATKTEAATKADKGADKGVRDKARAAGVSDATIDKMLDLAKPTRSDGTLIDLGCADGRLALRAAEKGLYVLAWDTDATFVAAAKHAVFANFRDQSVQVEQTDDLWGVKLNQADIIMVPRPERFCSLHDVRERLQPKLLALKPGVRIVSTQPLFPVASRVVPFTPPDEPGRTVTLYLFVTPVD